MPVELKKLIEETNEALGVKSGQTLQIGSLNLENVSKKKTFVLNRLGRLVYSLYRDHTELPNMYKVGYAVRVYLEISSNGNFEKFKTLVQEFLSGFNDPKHESVIFEEAQKSRGAPLGDK